MALTDNLVSFWNLENVNDSVGSNNLTNNNTATFVAGKVNNAVDLELSSQQSLTIADASQTGLDITGDLSISFWWKPETNNVFQWLVSKYLLAGNQRSYGIYFDGTNSLNFASSSDGTSGNTVDQGKTFTPSNGTWYHIVITYATSGTVTTYVNGSSLGTNTGYKTSIFNGSAEFAIGRGNLDSWTDGVIDAVGIWSRTIDSSEVTTLYNSGNGVQYPFSQNLTITADVGNYSITGYDAGIGRALTMIADVGSYIITGFSAMFRGTGWSAPFTKNDSTTTEPLKNNSTWTPLDK